VIVAEDVAELVAVLGTDIQQLMLLPVCPDETAPASVPPISKECLGKQNASVLEEIVIDVVNADACRCPLTSSTH
jgi:hypothetical protein